MVASEISTYNSDVDFIVAILKRLNNSICFLTSILINRINGATSITITENINLICCTSNRSRSITRHIFLNESNAINSADSIIIFAGDINATIVAAANSNRILIDFNRSNRVLNIFHELANRIGQSASHPNVIRLIAADRRWIESSVKSCNNGVIHNLNNLLARIKRNVEFAIMIHAKSRRSTTNANRFHLIAIEFCILIDLTNIICAPAGNIDFTITTFTNSTRFSFHINRENIFTVREFHDSVVSLIRNPNIVCICANTNVIWLATNRKRIAISNESIFCKLMKFFIGCIQKIQVLKICHRFNLLLFRLYICQRINLLNKVFRIIYSLVVYIVLEFLRIILFACDRFVIVVKT